MTPETEMLLAALRDVGVLTEKQYTEALAKLRDSVVRAWTPQPGRPLSN